MALRAVFILADGRLAYERLLRRLQAKIRSKYTIYCIFISRFGRIYGILFSLSDFAGNIMELEDVFSQFEVGCMQGRKKRKNGEICCTMETEEWHRLPQG